MAQSGGDAQDKQAQNGHTPLWEKIVGGLGMLFLVVVLLFLTYDALQPPSPPVITVTTQRTIPLEEGYLVEIEARNSGNETGAAVEIEGTLTPPNNPDAAPIETSTITLDYVPAQSTRNGGLFFSENPADYVLEVQAKGYAVP